MDKIAKSINALAAAVQTAADAYARYEAMKKRVRQLEHVCKINGIVVPGISDYTMSQPPFKEDA
jgi:hypothetical protein